MPPALFAWTAGVIYFLFWLMYLLLNRFLFSAKFSRIHILLTILIPWFILATYFIAPYLLGNDIVGMPRRYYDYSRHRSFTIMDFLRWLLYLGIIGQSIFLFNLITGIYNSIMGEKAENT
jgi:heme/copper-type cytochrome/quinol oxidase subunit 1